MGVEEKKEDVVLKEAETSSTSKKNAVQAENGHQSSNGMGEKHKDLFWGKVGTSNTKKKKIYGNGDKKCGPIGVCSPRYTGKERLVN